MYLINKIKAVNNVFRQADLHVSSFKATARISCIENCCSCCLKEDIETTILEFLPAAFELYQSGRYKPLIDRFGNDPGRICVFFNPFTPGASCSDYSNRGLLCRLFGFAAKEDKHETPVLVTCPVIRRTLDTEILTRVVKKLLS